MNTKKPLIKHERLLSIIPFLLVIVVMLPRLLSPQFGLLDDAATLARAEDIMDGDFNLENDLQAGRFRPIYWLFPAAIYLFADGNPFWYFMGFLIIFLLLLLVIQTLLKLRRAAPWQIFLTSVLFVFSIPIIENFYTLSKGEPLQLLFILVSLTLLEHQKQAGEEPKLWWVDFGTFLCILLAMMVKETTIILLPIALLWLAYVWLSKKNGNKSIRKAHLHFAITASLAVITIFLLRAIAGASSITEGTYSYRYQFSISSILMQIARWMTLLAFYFHYFFIYLFSLILVFIFGKTIRKLLDYDLIFWGIWCLLWLAVLIPWEYAEAYYLLPFSAGAAFLIGLTIPMLIQNFQQIRRIPRLVLIVILSLSGLLFGLTLPNYYTHARMQLTFDQMNHEMLVFVAENAPENGHVLINIEQENEYTEMIGRFLFEQYGREDIKIENVDADVLADLENKQDAWLLIPRISNQPRLTVRVGVEERFQSAWNETILQNLDGEQDQIFSQRETFRLVNVNLPVSLCPLIGENGFCERPDPLVDTRQFSYGWEIIQIN